MDVIRVAVSRTVPGPEPYGNRKLAVEIALEEGDTAEEAFEAGKDLIRWHLAATPEDRNKLEEPALNEAEVKGTVAFNVETKEK